MLVPSAQCFSMEATGSLMIRLLSGMVHLKCLGGEYAGTGVQRASVDAARVPWQTDWPDYSPPYFTSPRVIGKPWSDPEQPAGICFNKLDGKIDRKSHHGVYTVVDGFPLNPIGRTGLKGRGVLGRWGPNHAADPIVTTWKRINGSVVKDEKTGAPVMQFIGIKRRDTGEWALPGGMVDPGEAVSQTLRREFLEESMDYLTKTPDQQVSLKASLEDLFSSGKNIYSGYVDDRRNTDNAWIETVASNFHDDTGETVDSFKLTAGDDAVGVRWIDVSSLLNLYASHRDFIHIVSQMHSAHW